MSIVILGIDLGKNSCSIVGLDAEWERCAATADAPGRCDRLRREAATLHDGDGGVLRRPSHGSGAGGDWDTRSG